MSRILIVEDEVAIADLEKDYLELSGFEVEVENDGTSGLARLWRRILICLFWILCCRALMALRFVSGFVRKRTHRYSWFQPRRMISTR